MATSPLHSPLRAQREAAGLTIDELAALAECDPSYIWRLETGKRKGSPFFLKHLAQVLASIDADSQAS